MRKLCIIHNGIINFLIKEIIKMTNRLNYTETVAYLNVVMTKAQNKHIKCHCKDSNARHLFIIRLLLYDVPFLF